MNEHLWETEADPLALLAALHPMRTLGSLREQARPDLLVSIAASQIQSLPWGHLP